jgi:hypothetical protein
MADSTSSLRLMAAALSGPDKQPFRIVVNNKTAGFPELVDPSVGLRGFFGAGPERTFEQALQGGLAVFELAPSVANNHVVSEHAENVERLLQDAFDDQAKISPLLLKRGSNRIVGAGDSRRVGISALVKAVYVHSIAPAVLDYSTKRRPVPPGWLTAVFELNSPGQLMVDLGSVEGSVRLSGLARRLEFQTADHAEDLLPRRVDSWSWPKTVGLLALFSTLLGVFVRQLLEELARGKSS